jgi:hypothetical protein
MPPCSPPPQRVSPLPFTTLPHGPRPPSNFLQPFLLFFAGRGFIPGAPYACLPTWDHSLLRRAHLHSFRHPFPHTSLEGSCPRTCPLPHARNTRRPCSIFTSATCATRSSPPLPSRLRFPGAVLRFLSGPSCPRVSHCPKALPPYLRGGWERRGPSTPFCPSMVSVRPSVFLTQPPHPTPCGCVGPQYPTQWSTPSGYGRPIPPPVVHSAAPHLIRRRREAPARRADPRPSPFPAHAARAGGPYLSMPWPRTLPPLPVCRPSLESSMCMDLDLTGACNANLTAVPLHPYSFPFYLCHSTLLEVSRFPRPSAPLDNCHNPDPTSQPSSPPLSGALWIVR